MNTSDFTGAILVGLPHAGKSSYLALLYLAILKKKRCSIQLASSKDDREHVNTLMQALLKCEEASRTEVAQTKGLRLSVRDGEGLEWTLDIPDLSGETWLDALEVGAIDQDLFDEVQRAGAVVVFVHIGDFATDPLISAVNAGADALGADILPEDPESGPLGPSQVDIAQLLQAVDEIAEDGCALSIVLSAFDLAGSMTPREWLSNNAPLLDQYITANRTRRPIRLFGLSAQGGNFVTEKNSLSQIDGLERASILDEEGASVDVDAPILGRRG
ncbi:hypothetical protein IWX75_000007 [Arthrobacter sp. CAN_A6]|uniref:TRAFAC clade GTPase domain-containing protein n=1 Tax=Arthrobacter sp. CAN_A6 TaxID=2787721 RepID=UPI0018C9D601